MIRRAHSKSARVCQCKRRYNAIEHAINECKNHEGTLGIDFNATAHKISTHSTLLALANNICKRKCFSLVQKASKKSHAVYICRK